MLKKLLLYQWLFASLIVNLFTTHSFSQDVALNQKPSPDYGLPQPQYILLTEALKQIQTNKGVSFMFDPAVIKTKRVKNVSLTGTVEHQLKVILKPFGLLYKKVDNTHYIIHTEQEKADPALQQSRLSTSSTADLRLLQPQMIDEKTHPLSIVADIGVTGKVTDEKDQSPLPGVSVIIKGTTTGTTTDGEGNYSLTIPDDNAVLVFSFIGYVNQEIAVNTRTKIDVSLVSDVKELSEVVVVGYGTVQRRDLTGAVSSVGTKQLKDIPINSAAEALSGRLAGVQVTTSEGAPGADVQIVIRGGGSITQDNSPLYVVDGIQVQNALANLSPQDIESIDVLKDASATAIYGARGANGVIIITTKGGKQGRTTINYNGSFGFREIMKKLDVMSPYDFIQYQYERTRGSSQDSTNFAKSYGPWDTLGVYRNLPGRDWQEEVFGRKAIMQTHNLNISGGTKQTQYNLSITSNKEQGVMLGSDFDRKILNFRFDHQVSKKVKVGFNTRYNDQHVNGTGTSNPGTSATNRLRHSVQYRPFDLPSTSGLSDEFDLDYALATDGLTNPLLISNAEIKQNSSKLINLNGYFDFKIFNSLTFRSTVGYDNRNVKDEFFYGKITSTARQKSAGMPVVTINTNGSSIINNSNTLTYSALFTKKHDLSLLVGQEIYEERYNALNLETRYLPFDITPEKAFAMLDLGNPPSGAIQPRPTSDQRVSKLLSFFSRASYTFNDKYLATLTFRADGSSKFATKNRFGYFPSASVAWRVSSEEFMKKLPFVSELKLRASYGTSGNNRISDFQYTSTFKATSEYGLGEILVPGLAPTSLPNPDLVWETTVAQNLGLDLSLFTNRLHVTADVYTNKTKNLLVELPIPSTAGYVTQIRNIGRTSNSGVELQLSSTVLEKKNFTWTANFNITFNRNRVEDLGPVASNLYSSGWLGGNELANDYALQVGSPVGLMYGFITDGMYTVDDFSEYNPTTQKYTLKPGVAYDPSNPSIEPGQIKFKDQGGAVDANGNPLITFDADRTVIGNTNPKHFGGLNQQFTFKNFDMSVFVNWKYGNDVYNANNIEFTHGGRLNVNLLASMNDRWRTVNEQGQRVTDLEQLRVLNQHAKIWRPVQNRYYFSDWAVEDGSFLRINNITLGYTLPTKLTQRVKVNKLRFYATVNNLATLTGYSGYDPEVNTRRATPLTPGVDFSAYPRSRAFIFGLNLSL